MEHDIFYKHHRDTKERHVADKALAKKAMERFRSNDASVGEKIAALTTAGIMKAKVKLGMGLKSSKFSYKQKIKQCLRTLEKTKISLENVHKSILNCIQILDLNELSNKQQQPQQKKTSTKSTKVNKKNRRGFKKQKEMGKEKSEQMMDIDITDDYPMKTNGHKRKFEDKENSENKRIKLSDALHIESKPKLKAKRKLILDENTTENKLDNEVTPSPPQPTMFLNNLKKTKI